MDQIIPKTKYALIRVAKHILNTDDIICQSHVDELTKIISNHLNSGMSPKDIKDHYKIEYSNFGMFIKSSLNLTLKSFSEAVNNYFKKIGRSITDEKRLYLKKCEFSFDPYLMPDLPGYELLIELGMYHPIKNKFGVCRDHIVPKEYGWRNKIDPTLISHPANCQFLTNLDNLSKSTKSVITVDELLKRIDSGEYTRVIKNESKRLPLTIEHRRKISESTKKYMTLTNGISNIRILKTEPIPDGYRIGITRKSRKIKQDFQPQTSKLMEFLNS